MSARAVAGCRQRVGSDRLLDMVQMQDVGLVMFKPTDADATPEEYGQLDKAQGQDALTSDQVCGMWADPAAAACMLLVPLLLLTICSPLRSLLVILSAAVRAFLAWLLRSCM